MNWMSQSWKGLALPFLLFLSLPLAALLLRFDPRSILENLQLAQVQQAIMLSLRDFLLSGCPAARRR